MILFFKFHMIANQYCFQNDAYKLVLLLIRIERNLDFAEVNGKC